MTCWGQDAAGQGDCGDARQSISCGATITTIQASAHSIGAEVACILWAVEKLSKECMDLLNRIFVLIKMPCAHHFCMPCLRVLA